MPGAIAVMALAERGSLLAARGLNSGLAYSRNGRPGRVSAQSPGSTAPDRRMNSAGLAYLQSDMRER